MFREIADFFRYKEPLNRELGFELLEDINEGNENPKEQEDSMSAMEQEHLQQIIRDDDLQNKIPAFRNHNLPPELVIFILMLLYYNITV